MYCACSVHASQIVLLPNVRTHLHILPLTQEKTHNLQDDDWSFLPHWDLNVDCQILNHLTYQWARLLPSWSKLHKFILPHFACEIAIQIIRSCQSSVWLFFIKKLELWFRLSQEVKWLLHRQYSHFPSIWRWPYNTYSMVVVLLVSVTVSVAWVQWAPLIVRGQITGRGWKRVV